MYVERRGGVILKFTVNFFLGCRVVMKTQHFWQTFQSQKVYYLNHSKNMKYIKLQRLNENRMKIAFYIWKIIGSFVRHRNFQNFTDLLTKILTSTHKKGLAEGFISEVYTIYSRKQCALPVITAMDLWQLMGQKKPKTF